MTFSKATYEEFIRDPAFAAWTFFKADLDVFQSARLKMMWFVPNLIDGSGVSTGKTEIIWMWCQLRAILLPNPLPLSPRTIGVYYPVATISEKEFKPKYDKYIDISREYREELARTHGRKYGYEPFKGGAGFQYRYRNGAMVQNPPPGFAGDAKTSASRRYHDMVIEEYTQIDAVSNGIDEQLTSRVTAPAYNKLHPVFRNHTLLLGHHEGTNHPSYKRVRAFKKLIADGSQDHAIFSSCFRDYGEESVKKGYRPDGEIRTARITLTKAKFRQIWEGASEDESEDFYSEATLKKIRHKVLLPETRRSIADLDAIYAYGADTAPGPTRKSDFSTGVVSKAKPLPMDTKRSFLVWRHPKTGKPWQISIPWAWRVQGKQPEELSGVHHRMHQRFQFSRMVFDPNGGGTQVMRAMASPRQFFDGKEQIVTGLSSHDIYPDFPESLPIIVPWLIRSYELSSILEERQRSSEAGPVEAINTLVSGLMESRAIGFPAAYDDFTPAELRGLDAEQIQVLKTIDIMLKEFENVKVVLDKDGSPKMARGSYRIFKSIKRNKKDLAYGCLYSIAALLSYLQDPEMEEEFSDGSSSCMAGGE